MFGISYLHAVTCSLGHNVRGVAHHLHVPPGGRAGLCGQESQHLDVLGVSDADERGAGGTAHDGIILSVYGIVPHPDVVTARRSKQDDTLSNEYTFTT
jgi:hypothetical protein